MSEISEKQLKQRLEKLTGICGGIVDPVLRYSIEDTLDCLEVLVTYRRFDLEATRRELRDSSRK